MATHCNALYVAKKAFILKARAHHPVIEFVSQHVSADVLHIVCFRTQSKQSQSLTLALMRQMLPALKVLVKKITHSLRQHMFCCHTEKWLKNTRQQKQKCNNGLGTQLLISFKPPAHLRLAK